MKSKIIQILSYCLNTYTTHYPVQAKKNNITPKKKKKEEEEEQKRIQLYIDTIIQFLN